MRLKATGSRTTTPACPGVSRRKASQASDEHDDDAGRRQDAPHRAHRHVQPLPDELGQRRAELLAHDGHVAQGSCDAQAAAARPMTFSRRSSACSAKARVSSTEAPKSTTSSPTSAGTHFGRSTPSAIGPASTSARWMAAP